MAKSNSQTAKQSLDLRLHRALVSGGPLLLAILGVVLIGASFLARNDAALAGVYVTPGAALVALAVFLPRAKGSIKAFGVEAELMSLPDALNVARNLLTAALPETSDKSAKVESVITAAAAVLGGSVVPNQTIAHAGVAKGYAVAHTASASTVTLSRIDNGVVTTYVVPVDALTSAAAEALEKPADSSD